MPASHRTSRGIVRAGYDAIGDGYHSWSHRSETRLHVVRDVLDRLPAGSTVVDLGCGPGDPATRMLSERHWVLGVDLSAAQLAIAQRRAPGASFAQADLGELALSPGSVDAVVSFYALGHLPPDVHAPLFARIAQWLRPGGFLVTSAPLTAGEAVEENWLGVPMYFGGVGEAATLAAVAAAGLVLEGAVTVPEDEGGGKLSRFLWVTASKPGG